MNTLFKAANKGWKLLNKDKWFGSNYQLTSPSNWGQQYLAMNLNISIVNHVKKAFSIINKSINVQTENKKYTILGRQSIAHQCMEPTHRKTKNTKTLPISPTQNNTGVVSTGKSTIIHHFYRQ